MILETAKKIADEGEVALNLEKKVVLSIAIRLLAETKMIEVIGDDDFVNCIKKNQTATLIRRCKETVADDETQNGSLL